MYQGCKKTFLYNFRKSCHALSVAFGSAIGVERRAQRRIRRRIYRREARPSVVRAAWSSPDESSCSFPRTRVSATHVRIPRLRVCTTRNSGIGRPSKRHFFLALGFFCLSDLWSDFSASSTASALAAKVLPTNSDASAVVLPPAISEATFI